MTEELYQKLLELIRKGEQYKFYCWRVWRRKRQDVLKLDHYECQMCRDITRKDLHVHHVHHLEDRPDLALDIYDEDGKRNLITLCRSCHDKVHPEKHKNWKEYEPKYTNEERW